MSDLTLPPVPLSPQEQVHGQRRHYVTLLFSDLSRSTELAGAMEAEEFAALLATLRLAYQQTVPLWGGTIVRVQGDGLLAMFGHPVPLEDAGRRAVQAALALHQAVGRLAPPLPPPYRLQLHSGIHTGLVLIGDGDIERGRFELTGAVPNIAARLSEAAGPHEIVVSDETLGPARHLFGASVPCMLAIRGREAPILVHRIEALEEVAAEVEARSRKRTPLVGRLAELDQLTRALGRAAAGHAVGVEVVGPPGIGKTRLVEEFLHHARQHDWLVLRGSCDAGLGAPPLQPFRQMLQSQGIEPLPTQAPAFATALAELASARPLALFIDDWQWADDASHQVLAQLQHLEGVRMLTLLTRRAGGTPPAVAPGFTVLALTPLDAATATAAVSAQLPGADPFVVAQISSRAGGNPLFIEELCHAAARGERGPPSAGTAGWIHQLIEARVHGLRPALVDMLRTAAVIGHVVPAWLLTRLSGCPVDSPLLRELAEQEFLHPGAHAGTLRFKHGITRDVIYASVGLAQRQLLHLRIAIALLQQAKFSGEEDAEALALHFGAGGDGPLEAHYAELAGDRALAASALDRARLHFRAALLALERGDLTGERALRWVSIAERLAMLCMFDPDRRQIALAERALAFAQRYGGTRQIARARHWLGCVHYALGAPREAIRQGQAALAEAELAGDEPLAIQITASIGHAHVATGQYRQATPLLERAIEVKRRYHHKRRTDVGLAYALVCHGVVLGDQGRFRAAAQRFDDAQDCLVGATHQIGSSIEGWRAAVLLWQGDWAQAASAAAASADIAAATRSLWQLSIARAIGGYAQWMLTRDAAAVDVIVAATDWVQPLDGGLFRSLNHGWLADCLQQLGRADAARQHALWAWQRGRRGDRIGLAMAARAMARAAQAAGRPDTARRHLAWAYRVAQARGAAHEVAVTQWAEAELAAATGALAHARTLLDAAGSAFDRMAMPWHLAQVQHARTRL
jgi:class 3 adenylate cyclase/tetratricopeptide (TPR) repeat protein